MTEALWRIEMLGGLRAVRDGQTVHRFRSQKVAALLGYLAFYLQRDHPRELLVELLWPECDPAIGRHRLRNSLTSLRRQLEPPDISAAGVLLASHASVRLSPQAVTTDVAQFEAALAAVAQARGVEGASRLMEAVALYRGELLPGLYSDWTLAERQRLAEEYLDVLRRLTALLEEGGDLAGALTWARRAVAADPLREEAHHRLIELLVRTGDRSEARRQYRKLERLLAQELGTAPADEIRALVGRLTERSLASRVRVASQLGQPDEPAGTCLHRVQTKQRGQATERYATEAVSAVRASPGDFEWGPQPAAATPSGRIPLPLTRFFGRETEMARLSRLLTTQQERLVTLVGPGGSGKTRLAIELARRLWEQFAGAVWFVSLQDLTDASLMSDKILEVLGVPRSPQDDPQHRLQAFLSGQPSLVLLDNLEQLADAGAQMVEILLEQVDTLTLVVTSRRLLGLGGEQVFPVPPLPVPMDPGWAHPPLQPLSLGDVGDLDTLATNPSVQLLVDRAQAIRPDFQLTTANAATVLKLCQRLEGLPLAIELAASRISVLSPKQMLSRLDARFDLLVGRRAIRERRHQSLRATLDWSFDLLSLEIQRFLCVLSVFRGGWDLGAAEDVGQRGDALELLEELKAFSLIQTDSDLATTRCRMLESVREYAATCLPPAEQRAAAQRHAGYFLALAEASEPELRGRGQKAWLHRLTIEVDNFRAALGWAAQNGETETGLRLSGALGRFWFLRSYLEEGRAWLELFLQRSEGTKDSSPLGEKASTQRHEARAQALQWAGELALRQGDPAAANAHLIQGLEQYRGVRDARGMARVLLSLSWTAIHQGPIARVPPLVAECLAYCDEVADDWTRAQALVIQAQALAFMGQLDQARSCAREYLGRVRGLDDRWLRGTALLFAGSLERFVGEHAAARSMLDESVQLLRELDQPHGVAAALCELGAVARYQGELGAACSFLEESIHIMRQTGVRAYLALALHRLGHVACAQGDLDAAHRIQRESMSIFRERGSDVGVAESLEAFAELAMAHGQPERALSLLGAAGALREAHTAPPHPSERDECEVIEQAARSALQSAAAEKAWADGRTMSPDRAVADALEMEA